MALLSVSDFSEASKLYRIPAPIGANDTAELEGVIDFAEGTFLVLFGTDSETVAADETQLEALKYFTFAQWLRLEMAMRTPIGAGAVQELTQARNSFDDVKFREAWNTSCRLMGDEDNMIVPSINI